MRDACGQVGGVEQTRTLAGCTCQLVWTNRGQQFLGVCGNPDDDPHGDWCEVTAGSCQGTPTTPATAADDGAQRWDYCQVRKRLR